MLFVGKHFKTQEDGVDTRTRPPLLLLSKAAGMVNINFLIDLTYVVKLKSTLMQIEKVQINDCLTVLSVSKMFHISTAYNFVVKSHVKCVIYFK